jgi:hypothetical protein
MKTIMFFLILSAFGCVSILDVRSARADCRVVCESVSGNPPVCVRQKQVCGGVTITPKSETFSPPPPPETRDRR